MKNKISFMSVLLLIAIGIIAGCGGGKKGNNGTPQDPITIPSILDTSKTLVPAVAVLPDGVTKSTLNGKTVYNFVVEAEMKFEVEEAKSKGSQFYTWGSTNENVAIVSMDGLVKALQAGNAKIYALYTVTENGTEVTYHIPIDIIVTDTNSDGDLPGGLTPDNSLKFLNIYPTSQYPRSTAQFFWNGTEMGYAMTPGDVTHLGICELINNLCASAWRSPKYDYNNIKFYSTDPSVIEIVEGYGDYYYCNDAYSFSYFNGYVSDAFAKALKYGKATVYAVFDDNKYVSAEVEVTGFRIAFDRDFFKDKPLYDIRKYSGGLIEVNYSNYIDWYYLMSLGDNDILLSGYVDSFSTNSVNNILPLKVVPLAGVSISNITWKCSAVYPTTDNDWVKITQSVDGKNFQITPNPNKLNSIGARLLRITGTANNGMTYSFNMALD